MEQKLGPLLNNWKANLDWLNGWEQHLGTGNKLPGSGKKTPVEDIIVQIKKKRCTWAGHVEREEPTTGGQLG